MLSTWGLSWLEGSVSSWEPLFSVTLSSLEDETHLGFQVSTDSPELFCLLLIASDCSFIPLSPINSENICSVPSSIGVGKMSQGKVKLKVKLTSLHILSFWNLALRILEAGRRHGVEVEVVKETSASPEQSFSLARVKHMNGVIFLIPCWVINTDGQSHQPPTRA